MLTVPKYHRFEHGDEGGHLRRMGYREVQEGNDGPKDFESTDKYLERMQGYVLFHAALCQSNRCQAVYGLEHAWAWVARCALKSPEILLPLTEKTSQDELTNGRMATTVQRPTLACVV